MTALADPAASERDAELPKSGAKKPAGKRELVQTRAEETRERILDAAYEAFAKQGFEGANTRAIASHPAGGRISASKNAEVTGK